MELPALVDRVRQLERARPGRRLIVGITGAPGSGKSTLAGRLVAALAGGSPVGYVPMDGFHLADVELDRLGRRQRKGAPDTFDAAGYRALLARLRAETGTVWAPAFDRELEQPIAGSLPVLPGTGLIVTEGNYLLLDDPDWAGTAELLDEVWYCDPDERLRLDRLVARHQRFGKSPEQARRWATGPDQRNAELIRTTRHRADLVIEGDVG